ncbi:MAG TPA: FAD-linked oxidase C-terminal domain-containing protein [Dermatophilaceae bacterium]|nr:FAD-linked oxidase C-terminal domain-containing protein [Dermatophilaceae bacterium]
MPLVPPGVVSAEALVTDPDIAASYAVDSSYGATAPSHFEVVRARDEADVVAVLEHAHAHGIPVVPQGARTSVTGASTATEGAIVLNVEDLRALDLDPVEGHARVGPGVVTRELKAAAAEAGLAYPPDPASSDSCTLGGNVATNAGGLCCIKYGVTGDYVKGLEVVLPGGERMRTGKRTAKGVAGYDLTGLMVGSEGTLGVVTAAHLRLIPAPDPALTALATFDSLDAAVRGVLGLRALRHRPSLLEFLDAASLAAIQAVGDFGFPSRCAAALLVQSDRPGHAGEDAQRYAAVLADAGADEVAVADTQQEGELLMLGRRMLNHAYEVKGARLAEDMCVPIARLGDFVRAGQDLSARTGIEITLAGHGGDGNLHPSLFFAHGDLDAWHRAEAALDELLQICLGLGGTITGEHGIGTAKRRLLPHELGAAEMERQRAIKALFDPRGIMNPGKVY